MKINERTLMAHATSAATPVDKEGWLWKRGEVNRSFQRRYFVLKGNLLFYFEKKSDREPVGVVILEGCTVELAEEEQQDKFAFKVAFHGEGRRTYVLGAESQDAMEAWMKALSCASYDYLKLMVLELQQQLNEVEEAERMALTNTSPASTVPNGASPPSELEGEPSRPPRSRQQLQQSSAPQSQQRSNPFASTSDGAEGGKGKPPKKTWSVLHAEVGARIKSDRERWCRGRGQQLEQQSRPLIDLLS